MIETIKIFSCRSYIFFLLTLFFLVIPLNDSLAFHIEVDDYNNLRLLNEYIAIIVNQGPEDMGRFAVETTGGDPGRTDDIRQSLIYGRPRPWPSYTTIRIDGNDYVFGGSTERRAGRRAQFGKMVSPPSVNEEGELITIFSFEDNIEVRQVLSFIESSTTGLPDTAQIKYTIINHSDEAKSIGLRIMLDTLLGINDGAPFRIGDREILTDFTMSEDLPVFWQAFDSLRDPRVIAQGTLRGPMFTTPDRIYFSNWGSLADGIWHFNFQPGREFVREGEFELDSAMALYWDPVLVQPDSSITYITGYGLGGITMVPGLLSLGLTSPAEAEIGRPFPVIAYLENTAGMTAEEVEVEIKLPRGLSLAPRESMVKKLGNLDAEGTSQILWQVIPDPESAGRELSFVVEARARNTDSNLVERRVKVQRPAELSLIMQEPIVLSIQDHRLTPNPFFVEAFIKNEGGTIAHELKAWIDFVPGLNLAAMERKEKFFGRLHPGEEVRVSWLIHALGVSGDRPYAIHVHSINTDEIAEVNRVRIPQLSQQIFFTPPDQRVAMGDIIRVPLTIVSTREIAQIYLDMEYDSERLRLLRISRGPFFMEGGKRCLWEMGDYSYPGIIRNLGGEPAPKIGPEILTELHFEALTPGSAQINIVRLQAETRQGEVLDMGITNLEFVIESEKGGLE